MGNKIFKLGGIDQKTNPLLLPENMLRDSRNVMLSSDGSYVKRYGYVDMPEFQTGLLNESVDDALFFKSKNQYVVFKRYDDAGGTWRLIFQVFDGTSLDLIATMDDAIPVGGTSDPIERISIESDEYLNNLYFNIIWFDFPIKPMIRFDGYYFDTAGLPAVQNVTGYPGGTTHFWRIWFRYMDLNGNITYSPYKQFTSNTFTTNLSFDQIRIADDTFFYNKYANKLTASATQTITSSSRTINNLDHNYVAGDKLLISQENAFNGYVNIISPDFRTFVVLDVESVTANSITLTAASMEGVEIQFVTHATLDSPLDGRFTYQAAISTNAVSGFFLVVNANSVSGNLISTAYSTKGLSVSTTTAVWSSPGGNITMESVYDTATSKLRPPMCKYVKAMGDQLTFGNIIGLWDQNNDFSQFNNNDLLMYSDTGLGNSGENITALNRQKIGESYDGEITGLNRVKDTLVITKTNSLWSLDGLLLPAQYSVRKIESNYIGCLSNKSILQMESGLLFQGNDGLYFTNGFVAEKFTTPLDPFFTALDKTKTRSVVDFVGDKYLFYVTDNTNNYIVAFDYEFKQFFIWDSLNCSAGLVSNLTNDIVFFNNTLGNKFNNLFSDNGTPINAFIKTKFFDGGEPSLVNKFTELRIFNMLGTQWDATIDISVDWNDASLTQNKVLNFTGQKSRMGLIPIPNTYSVSLKIGNNSAQDLCISGFEFLIKQFSVADKTR